MFESCAIVRYLGARYGDEAFWPADPVERALLDQWAEWAKGTLTKTITFDIFWPMVRMKKADRDEEALATAIIGVGKLAKMMDARIGEGPCVNGEKLCFADIIFGHVLFRYYTLGFDRVPTPNLDSYYQRLTERPAYAAHVMVDYSSLRVE